MIAKTRPRRLYPVQEVDGLQGSAAAIKEHHHQDHVAVQVSQNSVRIYPPIDMLRDMKESMARRLVVAPSPVHGFGLFTTAAIPNVGTECLVYQGEAINASTLATRYGRGTSTRADYTLKLQQGSHKFQNIDASDEQISNGTRWINHGEHPNVKFTSTGVCVTIRPIAAGEELFVDYGPEYFADAADDAAKTTTKRILPPRDPPKGSTKSRYTVTPHVDNIFHPDAAFWLSNTHEPTVPISPLYSEPPPFLLPLAYDFGADISPSEHTLGTASGNNGMDGAMWCDSLYIDEAAPLTAKLSPHPWIPQTPSFFSMRGMDTSTAEATKQPPPLRLLGSTDAFGALAVRLASDACRAWQPPV